MRMRNEASNATVDHEEGYNRFVYPVTYAPDFQIVLTRRCAFVCGYCNFPQTPSPMPPSRKAVRRLLRTASRLGASQITLSAGEGISETEEILSVSRYYGYTSWWDYLRGMCSTVLETRGPRPLMPVLDVGAIPVSELRLTREYVAAVRLMLHSGDEKLMRTLVHGHAPQKAPAQRLSALEELGRWNIPVTTGILVGIEESSESWIRTVRVVNGLYARHGHIHNFVVQPFTPLPFSPMALHPPVSDGMLIRAVGDIREALDPRITLTVELQNRMHLAPATIRAGASDFGSTRVGSSERIEFDIMRALDDARQSLLEYGIDLQERSAVLDIYAESGDLPPAIAEALTSYIQNRPQHPSTDRGTAAYG